MNDIEQRRQKTAIDKVRSEMEQLEEDVSTVVEEATASFRKIVEQTEQEFAKQNQITADKIKEFHDAVIADYDLMERKLIERTFDYYYFIRPGWKGFWERLRWLIVGSRARNDD
jgi:hypothetical protein